ncbi:10596_t:CDS:2 [Funneliformis caledonium]|uniref:10596_t:CDS:1 n=1 Tax=Funneliformis caledonium TaxID=1117310 RepID=A0A9N9DZ51_9GLOM|nr:10596_t:CDS:2 [Funneliformis caledonium]
MTQLKPVRIPDNTKRLMNSISKIVSLLNIKSFSHSFLSYLICCLIICNLNSFGVYCQQINSDGTISVPFMQWTDLKSKLSGSAPPGLKDFAFGYSKESNLVIIFGGTTPSGGKSGITYIIDFNENSWKRPADYGLPTSNQLNPEARSNMIFGVDKSSSYRNAFIIACGVGSGNMLYNDVWAFDFNYKQWTKVENVTGEIPPMYGSFGGIDVTLATPSQTEEKNTLWASHGTNGTHFFTDLYALVLTGTLIPNLMTLTATWYKVPVDGEIPTGRNSVAGTILPNKRLVMYGGCDNLEGKCAKSDAYSLNLGSNYLNGQIPTSATPLWSKKNSCLGARSGAAMSMNSNPAITYPNQAIVYGGSSPEGKSVGSDGEIGVLDADLGNWVRVLPERDPVSGFPPQRAGAQLIPIPVPIGAAGIAATDILLFGGEGLDGNKSNLNDLWLLRLYTNATSGDAAKSSPMEFLSCIQDVKVPNSGDGDNKSGDSYDFSKSTPKGHVQFSTLSYLLLPLSASVIRFGYGSNQKFTIAMLYTIFIAASYATAFYGFAIAFQDIPKSSHHFVTSHGLIGLVLLILLYIFVPIMAITSLCVIGGSGCFNWRNSESNSKSVKSFEVSRPGNRLASGEVPPTVKPSNNWMEARKGVTMVESHPTMSSQGSRNDSLQNGPTSTITSQSSAITNSSRRGLDARPIPSIPDQSHPASSSFAIKTKHAHHIIAQLILVFTAIFIGVSLYKTRIVGSLYFYAFIGFMVIIYLIWIIAAWYGYPKGRNSLLVLIMHEIGYGKGEINEMKKYDFEGYNINSSGGATISSPQSPSDRMRNVRSEEDDDMDEAAEQAQLEQDMYNREVVVMTIPKRRLTVVNA